MSAPLSSFSLYGVLADNQFAGNYAGTYAGTSSGTWNAAVNARRLSIGHRHRAVCRDRQRHLWRRIDHPARGFGTSQGFAIKFDGTFTLVGSGPGVSAAGTWSSSSGERGTWVGSKTN